MGFLRKFITPNVLFISVFSFSSYAATISKGDILAPKQVLNIGIMGEPPTIDPQKVEDIISGRVISDLYEPLLTENDYGDIIPGLAEKYEVSPDFLTYTFHLRPNLKFSDGSPLTAEDVVYSFQRTVDPKVASGYGYITYDIVNAKAVNEGKLPPNEMGVKAINPQTVAIHLQHPVPYFNRVMAIYNFGIVSKANVEKYGANFTQPGNLVSSGAFTLKYWKIGDKIVAEKNPYYWNANKTIIKTVNYFPIVDENTELKMYQTNQIDFTWLIPMQQIDTLRKEIPKEVNTHPFLGSYYYDLNTTKPPFKDNVNLRLALSMVIDRDVLTKLITKRGEIPAYDITPPGAEHYQVQNPEWAKWPMSKRIEEAKKLYLKSGYSKDKPLQLKITYNTNTTHKGVALTVTSMWKKAFQDLGLQVQMQNLEYKAFVMSRDSGDYQIARDGWNADYNDASTFVGLAATSNAQNIPRYHNPEFDKLVEMSAVEMDVKKREALLEKAERMMLSDSPFIPLYNYVSTHLVKPYVGGYTGKNPQDIQYSREFYIKKDPLKAS